MDESVKQLIPLIQENGYEKSEDRHLDPADWPAMRKLGHQMVDDMMDLFESLREKPVWKKPGAAMKAALSQPLPEQPEGAEKAYEDFKSAVMPYYKGNLHPRFWAWIEGNGTPFGMLAEMLAAGLNPNLGIGDHGAVYVEMQVLEWSKNMVGFPADAGGLLVSGGSMANMTALTVARNSVKEKQIRKNGVDQAQSPLTIYCSAETHSCVQKAVEMLGLGNDALRRIPADSQFRIDLDALKAALAEDRKNGCRPFCVVGNAGTVNTGAIDPLDELADLCQKEGLWFHIDGAYGGPVAALPEFRQAVKGIERADSLVFDYHKWLYMPYESACVLVKDKKMQREAFNVMPIYLQKHTGGLADGPDPLSNYGPQLSRGFRALKIWLSLKEHGMEKYRQLMRQNISQARYLGRLAQKNPYLELMAPVTLSITCFRYVKQGLSTGQLNEINKNILVSLQEEGIAAPSYTIINGCYSIRAAITNHRSRREDFDTLADNVVRLGHQLTQKI